MSIRLKLTLSYAGFLMIAGVLLLAAVWLFLLRYVPDRALVVNAETDLHGVFPIRSNLLREFAPRAAAVLAFLLGVGLTGGWYLAGRMLAPVSRITDAARQATSGSLSHRIRLSGRQDEFRDLADTFDVMLDQIETHVTQQRRFAANASHELRTPLTITQTLLEVACNDPDRNVDELLARLHTVNTRAIDLTEALLVLSRADQRAFSPQPIDLSLLAEEATESLMEFARQRSVSFELATDAAPASGSPPLLFQLTTNLVHNAIVHNLTEGGLIWVKTGTEFGRSVLCVENTGRELDPQLVATLEEPFRRGADRLRADHGGVGLGLAIAKSITQAHDGTLTLEPRASGGLRVSVRLPIRQ
jgi:two-component system sensor histidine kinase VanS